MKIRVLVEDDDGNEVSEEVRQIEEGVMHFKDGPQKVLYGPMEDLVYQALGKAENYLNEHVTF